MITEITKAQLLALHVRAAEGQGKIEPAHISMLKRNNVRDGARMRAAVAAICWAPTASWTSIRSCATCAIWKR